MCFGSHRVLSLRDFRRYFTRYFVYVKRFAKAIRGSWLFCVRLKKYNLIFSGYILLYEWSQKNSSNSQKKNILTLKTKIPVASCCFLYSHILSENSYRKSISFQVKSIIRKSTRHYFNFFLFKSRGICSLEAECAL